MNDRAEAAVAIVPVRLGSQRLPGKAMLAETGTPLFLHTWERAIAARAFGTVLIATDSEAVAHAAERHGAEVAWTTERPRTGSERCAEAAAALPAGSCDVVVDIQGDWPEVAPADLDALVDCLRSGAAPTATLAAPLDDDRAADPNVVKVVRALDGDALYFSRAAIPFARGDGAPRRLRHIGVYGFTLEALLAVPDLPSSGLAETESLEQLRFLENGLRMRVLDAQDDPWGIETRDDYDAFLRRRAARGGETR